MGEKNRKSKRTKGKTSGWGWVLKGSKESTYPGLGNTLRPSKERVTNKKRWPVKAKLTALDDEGSPQARDVWIKVALNTRDEKGREGKEKKGARFWSKRKSNPRRVKKKTGRAKRIRKGTRKKKVERNGARGEKIANSGHQKPVAPGGGGKKS